jgi:hypothetical protein
MDLESNRAEKLKALHSELVHSEQDLQEYNAVYIFSKSLSDLVYCADLDVNLLQIQIYCDDTNYFLHFVQHNSYGILHPVNTLFIILY